MLEGEGERTSAAAVQEEEKDTRIPYNSARLRARHTDCPKCGDRELPKVDWVPPMDEHLGYLSGRCQRCKAELFKMCPRDTIYIDADPASNN